MLEVVRDATWRPEIRNSATGGYARQRGNRAKPLEGPKALAQAVYAGTVVDPDDNPMGTLLDRLYPEGLSEPEVPDYLKAPTRPDQVLTGVAPVW